jgi:hypothetical protein
MDKVKTVKGLPFSGKKSEFAIWKFKFLACCSYQKCYEILMDDNMIEPRYDVQLDPKTDKNDINARTQNAKAYMLLSSSISPTDTVTCRAVQNATTKELPTGDAKKAWKNIFQIHQTTTRTELHELEWQFNHCSLSDENLNPDKWFSKLENLRIRLKIDHKYEISDDKMITQILYNAPSKHYATMVIVLKLEMAKGKLDLEEIKQAFRNIYGTI